MVKQNKQVGKALGRVSSGLFILTAKHEKQEDAVLASWVNQCSFSPPALTVALATVRPARLLVEASEAFILNVLGKDDKELLKHFFKPQADPGSIFEGLEVSEGLQAIKILDGAVSYLECRLARQTAFGDHVLYVGEVVGGGMLKGGEPYVHFRENGFNY